MTTQLMHMSKLIILETKQINPHTELPWRRSEHSQDLQDQIQFYILVNGPGTSAKLEWAEDHSKLFDEHKEDEDFLFIYMDGSLSYKEGTCKTGYRVTTYWNGEEITS